MGYADSNITVIEIRDIQSLVKHGKGIDKFLDDHLSNSNLYHYTEYIKTVIDSDTTIKVWNILLIKDSGQLVAIIPIYICKKEFPIKFALFDLLSFKINLLKLFGNNISYRSDYNLSIIHNILKKYLESGPSFDLGVIDALPADSSLFSDINGKSKGDFVVKSISKKSEVVRYITFPKTWGDYLTSMKRKRRYNLKRSVKILTDKCNGNVDVKCFESVDDVESFLKAMEKVYKDTWQFSSFGNKSRLEDSEINQNKALARLGFFKSYILFSSQTAIAFIRGYLYKGKYYYEEIGYSQGWAKYNPGSVLNFLMLQLLMEGNSDVKELNFGYGENVYKQVFSNGDYEATNGYIYKIGSRGNLIFFIQQKLDFLYIVIRKIIIKLNLDVMVRRILRKKKQ